MGSADAKAHAHKRPVREAVREGARGTYRSAILEAAERVFARAGFYETRMADIAREAGVGVGTLYNYFDSKELILEEILATLHDEFMTELGRAATSEDPIERLRQIVGSLFASCEVHGALFAVFMERGAIGEYDVERIAGSEAARGYTEFLSVLDETVRAAIRKKRLRTDVEPSLIVAMLSGAMNGATYAWLKRGRSGGLTEVTDELFELFLQGARHP